MEATLLTESDVPAFVHIHVEHADNQMNDDTQREILQTHRHNIPKQSSSSNVPEQLKSLMKGAVDGVVSTVNVLEKGIAKSVNTFEHVEGRILRTTRGMQEKRPTVDDPQLTSLNYDDLDDYRIEAELESGSGRFDNAISSFLKFSITVFIAFLIALAMWGVRSLVKVVFNARNGATLNLIENGKIINAFFQYLFISVVMCCSGALLCAYVAPAARGGGVPYVSAYLNGTNLLEFFSWRVVSVKLIALATTVAGGITLGREGPFVFLGGGIALNSCKIIDLFTFKKRTKWSRVLRNIREERIFIAGGMAAGLAVAFSAPIAGVLLAMEGTTTFLTQLVLVRIFCCSMFGMLFSDLMYSDWSIYMTNHNLILVSPDITIQYNYMIVEVLAFLVIGVLGGVIGAAATKLNVVITKWRHERHMEERTLLAVAEVAAIAAVTCFCFFTLPYMFSCSPVVSSVCVSSIQIQNKCLQLHCPAGYYSEIGTIIYSTSDEVAALLFDRSLQFTDDFQIAPLLLYGIYYFFLVCWAYGAMVPGGLFVPSIIIGAVYGRILGVIAVTANSNINPGVYALLGAASMLGGFTRLALPISVMMIEMTGDATYLLPIMLCTITGKSTADLFTMPLYPQHMAIEHIPVLTDVLNSKIANKTAAEIMKRNPTCLPMVASLNLVMDMLDRSKSSLLPVVTQTGAFFGVVKRSQLIYAMKYGLTFNSIGEALGTNIVTENLQNANSTFDNLSKNTGRAWQIIDDNWANTLDQTRTLKTLDKEMTSKLLDLREFVDCGVLCVRPDSSARRCANFLRKLGSTHAMVVDGHHHLVGVITRRNFLQQTSISDPVTNDLSSVADEESGLSDEDPECDSILEEPLHDVSGIGHNDAYIAKRDAMR